MSKIERLIEELCPDGVEFYKISDIADTYIGLVTCMTKNYRENGVLMINNSNIKEGYFEFKKKIYLDSYFADKNEHKKNKIGDILTVHTGDVGTSAIINESLDGCIGFATITTRIKDKRINNKFVCALLNSKICKNQIKKMTKGDRNNLNLKDYNKLLIPVPPLPIQEEIVRILDSFTEKTNELKAQLEEELEARKKQYEWYRNELLIEKKEYLLKELGSVCTFVRGPFGGALKKEIFKTEGYAVYEQQNAIYQNLSFRYFVDSEKFTKLERFSIKPGDMIVSCSGTIGKTFIIPIEAPKGIINQALLKLTPNREMINVYYLQFFFENTISKLLNNVSRGGAIKNVPSVNELKKIKIPLPSLEEQQRIVDILDRFDKLCNDISEGLPAEIDARQKQYEYYRDKLLTFKRLEDREGIEDERV